jgi:response regulator RpfG family c-di-GMP phosphodiesterase
MSSTPKVNQVTDSIVDQPSKILVVDDEAIIQTHLYEVLTEEGYEDTTADIGKIEHRLLKEVDVRSCHYRHKDGSANGRVGGVGTGTLMFCGYPCLHA